MEAVLADVEDDRSRVDEVRVSLCCRILRGAAGGAGGGAPPRHSVFPAARAFWK